MKTANRTRVSTAGVKRRRKPAKIQTAPTNGQVAPKSIKYSAKELAGCLRRYAKGRPDAALVREFVRQEVARATARRLDGSRLDSNDFLPSAKERSG